MTRNRNAKRRIRLRASRTGESYTTARRMLYPANRAAPVFETQRPADYLLRAAGSAIGHAYKSLAVERLGIRPGETILDVGCGTGGELGLLLDAVGPEGAVIGLDSDTAALAAARALHADERLRLVHGDAHALDLADGSIDRVYADRTVQHVERPEKVLAEARRVLRPGGMAVFAEPDWRTLLIDCPEPDLAEAYRRFVVEQLIRNTRIGGELPRLAQRAGLELASVHPVTATYTDAVAADLVLGFARVTRRAVAAGYLRQDEAERWLGHLGGDVFFASLTLFVTAARAAD